MTRSAAIFDIDGTLANNEHRRHFIERPPGQTRDWAAFNERMVFDKPNPAVSTLLNFSRKFGLMVVLATGRGEEYRSTTEKWLSKFGLGYDLLLMRPAKDYRPDTEIKREMLDKMRSDGIAPQFVVDDRNSVVAMWRDSGLTCFQVADGDF